MNIEGVSRAAVSQEPKPAAKQAEEPKQERNQDAAEVSISAEAKKLQEA